MLENDMRQNKGSFCFPGTAKLIPQFLEVVLNHPNMTSSQRMLPLFFAHWR